MSVKTIPPQGATRGFTLVEVLVALAILSIGLLGIAKLQVSMVRYNQEAFLRTQATLQAYDMADRMRANLQGVQNGSYDNIASIPSDPGCLGSGCTPATMAQYDAYAWNTANANTLPSGAGSVTAAGNGRFTIAVNWTSRDHGATGTQSFSTTIKP